MAKLAPELIAEINRLIELHKRPDGSPNIQQIAGVLGKDWSTAQRWIQKVQAQKPRDQFSTYEEIHAPQKPRVRVKAVTQERPSDAPIFKVMAIGDAHEKPGRCKERFRWFGRHAAATRPDAIVSIGDWASLDSLSTHEQPGSANDADRPSFHEELDSLDESISLFHRDLPVGSIPTYITLGNHEYRAWRAANRQPKQNGDMPQRLEQVFARYRWQTTPFGEFLPLYGVDFVHVPLSIMGKEMGGELVERNVGIKSMRSVIMGHTHRANVVTVPKVGQQRKLTVVNLGTAMPHGMTEKYTGVAMSGWSYGIFELRIQEGQILSAKHFDMIELSERYA